MAKAKTYTTFENVKIRYALPEDKQGMDGRYDNMNSPDLVINSRIRWLNCEFDNDYWLVMRNIRFADYLAVFNCSNIKAKFNQCTFGKTFRLYGSQVDFIDFDTCKFNQGFKYGRNSVKDHLMFNTCSFTVIDGLENEGTEYDMEARIFFLSNKGEPMDLTIQNSTFILPEKKRNNPQYFCLLTGSSFNNLKLTNNHFDGSVDFSQSTVSNTFISYDCMFDGKVILDAFNFNPVNTRVQWSTINNFKIGVPNKNNFIVSGALLDSLNNAYLFDNLISSYASFYNSFKSQGNRISANQCYVEWKNIETNYLKQLYTSGKDKSVFFNYLMDLFLRTFCDYGTNPLKAIKIAFFVLLAFAGIYFFFPHSILKFHKRTMFEQLKIYGHYLASPKSLLEIEDSEFAKETDTPKYSDYVSFITESKGKVPWYFHLFGKPIFFLEKLKQKPINIFYKLIDFFPDEWEKLSASKKLFANVLYGLVSAATIIWFFVIHTLDSIALSLNVFSTLGFGQIPIKGIPRYLTILEGFIGWFLLSIFSVSLISQVIQ